MYSTEEKKILLEQAKSSIEHGLNHQNRIEIDGKHVSEKLLEHRACFVTLLLENKLRGCIGSLNANQPLIKDINYNAYAAAFEDPRFSPLRKDELPNINIEISVLSVPEEIIFSDEENLLSQLRIGIDGVIFECRQYRATYLPTVWSSLKTPEVFLNSLKEKAGLNSEYWSKDVHCYRYITEIIK